MNFPKPILLGETASTNTYLAERCNLERLPELTKYIAIPNMHT